MSDFGFESPWMLLTLMVLVLFCYLYRYSEKQSIQKAIKFSRLAYLEQASKKIKDHKKTILITLFIIGTIFGCLSLARPYMSINLPVNPTKIILAFDISISMEATDMKPNRLEAARETAIEFIKKIPKDVKIGLEYFYGNAYMPIEVTTDKRKIIDSLKDLTVDNLFPGTAIGTAIDGAVSGLNINKDNSIVVLLTDGESNQGVVPSYAAEQAQKNGVKVFTIGIGSKEGAYVRDNILTTLDEGTLMEIANITGAKYYRAINKKELKEIYKELTTKQMGFEKQRTELTFVFSGLSLLLFLILAGLKLTIFRVVY